MLKIQQKLSIVSPSSGKGLHEWPEPVIKYMPVVKFTLHLDLEEKISFLDRHRLVCYDFFSDGFFLLSGQFLSF